MKHSRSYTLIEILVALALISITSTLFFFNFKKGGEGSTVALQKRFLINVLRRAQTMAVHGAVAANPSGGSFSGKGGYGVYIEDQETFLIFADENKDESFQRQEFVERFTLPSDMSFDKILFAIHFSAILGEITLTPQQIAEDPFSFRIIQGNKEVIISINKSSGRID